MNSLLILAVCLLTCAGQLCQKKAVESWRGKNLSWNTKLFDVWFVSTAASGVPVVEMPAGTLRHGHRKTIRLKLRNL
jgi:hypothetical protein